MSGRVQIIVDGQVWFDNEAHSRSMNWDPVGRYESRLSFTATFEHTKRWEMIAPVCESCAAVDAVCTHMRDAPPVVRVLPPDPPSITKGEPLP